MDNDIIPEVVEEILKRGEELDRYFFGDVSVYAKKPTKKVIDYFTEQIKDKSVNYGKLQKNFVKMSIVYPTEEGMDSLEDDMPAIYLSLSNAILERAGLVNFGREKLSPEKK